MKGVKEVKTSRASRASWSGRWSPGSIRWSPGSLDPGISRVIVALFTSLTLFTSLPRAQQVPTFRARTDLVELDISVLDKNRRPVRGLTAADFTVFEDGKPQQISIFEAIDVPDPEPPPVEWMRDVTPDVTTNETRVTRLWVIAIDDALIPQDPFAIKSSKQIVRQIVEKFGPDDLATIVFTADSRFAQDFTADRTKLLATLEKYNPGLAHWRGPVANQVTPPQAPETGLDVDEQFWLGSTLTLRNIMDSLVAVPHTRKNLIWVTPGVPMNVYAPHCPLIPPQPCTSLQAQVRLRELTKEVLATARRANVPVYPIDPMGLDGMSGFLQLRRPLALVPGIISQTEDYALLTAANTGGKAIMRTNDFTPGINGIFEENKSYYLIGFTPTNTKPDGTLRQLEVRVNREDVTVRTRDSYVAAKPGELTPKSTNATLSAATASSVPLRDLPLRATVAPFAIPGGRNAAVAITLGVRQAVPESAAKERVTVTTELRTIAFTTEGDVKGTQRHTARVVLRAGAQGDADYEALSRIDLPPGRYRLRLAALHEAAAKTGTVMVDIVVPDFNRDPASMSGVVLSAAPGRPSAPRDLLNDVLPTVPTAQRAFTATDRATALAYVYQSGTKAIVPAQVTIRVTDARGSTLISDAQGIPVDRFVMAETVTRLGPPRSVPPGQTARTDAFANKGLRAAEVQYALPLSRLALGRYLLTMEATVGAAVLRRDVQFELR